MPLYRPGELFPYLESLGVRPKRGLSQNFLIDGNTLRKIVALAEIKKGDNVLEIGPGPGALTEQLQAAANQVVAVEKDNVFAPALKKRPWSNLTVYHADILDFSIENIASLAPLKIVANLPYSLTTPILEKFVKETDLFTSLVVMVQQEVAERMTAKPGSKTYGSLTVFLNFFADVSYGFFVPKTCFYPVPKVDSAVVKLTLKKSPNVNREIFFQMTRTAFQKRRKTIASSLKSTFPGIDEALLKAGIPKMARPETLSLSQFIDLYNAYHNLDQ